MDVKSKAKALSSLRKISMVNKKKIHLGSLKLFDRLIIFAQRHMTVETSLQYELTPFPKLIFSTVIYRYPNLSSFFQGFPRELDVNILKHVITHLYKHIGERNCLVFMFISITFPKLLDCMERWKHSFHTGLMQIRHLYSNYFFVVLIGCSRHLMLTAYMYAYMYAVKYLTGEVFDIFRLADNTKMKLIYVSIAVKFSRHLVIWHPF